MKTCTLLSISAAFALLLTATGAVGSEQAHWGYSGENGPEHWGSLSPGYNLCSTGRNQSPVNLTGMIEAELKPLVLNYTAQATEVINNGHSIQLTFAPGGMLEVEGRSYGLKQIHFHSPSENAIDTKTFPLEGHLVHADEAGNLAVVAVMYVVGAENQAFTAAWESMPMRAGEKMALTDGSSAATFLPADHNYYRFNGSLTTPPCSEGVTWLVMKAPAEISTAQLKRFQEVMGGPTARPLQPINARVILE